MSGPQSQPAEALPAGAVEIAIAVVEHAGRYLIGQRPAGVPLAGLWEFPGGKVRAGETPALAAARECLEETGLAVRVGDRISQIVHAYEHARVRLHFFACTPLDASRPPAAPFRWTPAGELCQHEFPAANAGIVRFLAERAAAVSPPVMPPKE
jgi:8-oxo-dGTP diphosphatase